MVGRIASTYEARPDIQQELVQDAFTALWRALPSFRADAALKTYLGRIAHNVCISHVRQAVRRPEVALSEEPIADETGPEAAVVQGANRQRLVSAIRRLPLNYRQVVSLHLEDFSDAEIAEALDLTVGNVAVRLTRARDRLKRLMEVSQ